MSGLGEIFRQAVERLLKALDEANHLGVEEVSLLSRRRQGGPFASNSAKTPPRKTEWMDQRSRSTLEIHLSSSRPGAAFTYAPIATGTRAMTWSLTTSPTGATIDPATGLIGPEELHAAQHRLFDEPEIQTSALKGRLMALICS